MENWVLEEVTEKENLLKELKICGFFEQVCEAGQKLSDVILNGNKILLAGNGGSAADAQHFAGEMVGRFLKERNTIPAISMCVDPSVMTCIGNDYGFDQVFARQIRGLGNHGDALIGISTSGNSKNIITAIMEARKKDMLVIGILGRSGGEMKELCDIALVVPSKSTPRIQEMHEFIIHVLCEMIEKKVFE